MITAEYLPGRLNTRADWVSQNFQDSSEWLISQKIISQGVPEMGCSENRLVCFKGMLPTASLYNIETRSSESSNRCSTDKLEKSRLSVCLLPPPFSLIGRVLVKVGKKELA